MGIKKEYSLLKKMYCVCVRCGISSPFSLDQIWRKRNKKCLAKHKKEEGN